MNSVIREFELGGNFTGEYDDPHSYLSFLTKRRLQQGMTGNFQFNDMHGYAIDYETHSQLWRPILEGGNWKVVKYWNVLEYERVPYTPENVRSCCNDILENLSSSFLNKKYMEENSRNPLFGYCYLTSQTLFYLLKTENLSPFSAQNDLGVCHWWLQDNLSGAIIDPTASQYDKRNCDIPYATGKKKKWYGFKPAPQQKTLDLIEKIQLHACSYKTSHQKNFHG